MKHIRTVMIAILATTVISTVSAHAAVDFRNNGLSFEAGKIQEKDGRSDLYFASIIPQFSVGSVTAVLNINYIATSKYKIRDGGHDFLVLDSLRYKRGEEFNLSYGEIKNLTYGNGLIVSNYRSDILGNVPLNRQRGMELDIDTNNYYIKAFGTQSDLYGMRGVRNFGSLRLGATAVTDSNPNFDEVGVDVETHFRNDRIRLYAESAQILKYGDGKALGAIVVPVRNLSLKAEYRDYAADFIPGIVDEHYEAGSPFYKIAGSSRTHGMFTALGYSPNAETSLALTNERYKDRRPRTTVTARGRISRRLSGDLFYAQENYLQKDRLANPRNSIARAILTFKLTSKLGLILDYYQAYDDSLQKQDSLTFKAHFRFF
jgi:hypothetical protein